MCLEYHDKREMAHACSRLLARQCLLHPNNGVNYCYVWNGGAALREPVGDISACSAEYWIMLDLHANIVRFWYVLKIVNLMRLLILLSSFARRIIGR